jgi:hypothetical protein
MITFTRPESYQLYRYKGKTKWFFIGETKNGDGKWVYILQTKPVDDPPQPEITKADGRDEAETALLDMYRIIEGKEAPVDSFSQHFGSTSFGIHGTKAIYRAKLNSDDGLWDLSIIWNLRTVQGIGPYDTIGEAKKGIAEYIQRIDEEREGKKGKEAS